MSHTRTEYGIKEGIGSGHLTTRYWGGFATEAEAQRVIDTSPMLRDRGAVVCQRTITTRIQVVGDWEPLPKPK